MGNGSKPAMLAYFRMVWCKKQTVQSTSNCLQRETKPPLSCSHLLIKLDIWLNDLIATQSLDSSWITTQRLREEKLKVAQKNIVLQLHLAKHREKEKTGLDSIITLATLSLHNTMVFYLIHGNSRTLGPGYSWCYWLVSSWIDSVS